MQLHRKLDNEATEQWKAEVWEAMLLEYAELQAETRIEFVRIHVASGGANNATSLRQTETKSISIRRACVKNVKRWRSSLRLPSAFQNLLHAQSPLRKTRRHHLRESETSGRLALGARLKMACYYDARHPKHVTPRRKKATGWRVSSPSPSSFCGGGERSISLAKSPAEDPRNQEIPLMGGLGRPEGGSLHLQQGRWFQPASAPLAQVLAVRVPVWGEADGRD